MKDALRQRWRAIAESFASPFRPLAVRIAESQATGFETAWLMADFGQLCVRYPALLLLSHGYRHPDARPALFDKIEPGALARATLGTWIRFLEHGSAVAWPQVARPDWPLPQAYMEHVRRLVERRNELAHGALGRFDPDETYLDRFSEDVLRLAEALRPICTLEPATCGHSEPFVLPGTDDLLLYDTIDDAAAVFVSSRDRHRLTDQKHPAVGPVIRRYLQPDAPAAAAPGRPTGSELGRKSGELLRRFRSAVDSDFFVTDRYFGELPPFGGRPTLAEHAIEAVRDRGERYALHLYGPRGCGKRRYLADLLDALAGDGHVVVPLSLSRGGAPSAESVAQALGCTGDVATVSEDVRRGTGGRLVVAAIDLAPAWARETYRQGLADLGRACRDAAACLILVSDATELEPSLAGVDWCTHEPMPPMEPEATASFFARIIAKPGHTPLTDWDLLRDTVVEFASNPARLVTMCQVYHGRPLDDFDAGEYRHRLWRDLIAPRPGAVALGPLVTTLANAMRARRKRSLPRSEPYDGLPGPQREGRAQELEWLHRLGYLDIDERVRFADFEWLMRALVLTLPPPAAASDDAALRALVVDTESFTPLGDALAEWAGGGPAALLRRVFRIVIESNVANRGRLVHALLARAYAHEDGTLLGALADEALSHADEVLCRGCAGVAQQMTQEGRPEAARAGGELLERCLRAARAHGFTGLEATLLNEHAQYAVASADVAAREREFALAVRIAHDHGLADVEHTAANNLAEVRLGKLRLPSDEAAPEDVESASRIVADLEAFAGTPPSRENWLRLQLTHRLLARACGYLGAGRHDGMRRWGTSSVDLATRMGTFAQRSAACQAWGSTLAAHGLDDEAIEAMTSAARFARLSSLAVPEAHCERELAHLVWRRADAEGREARADAGHAFAHYRRARRALHVLPSKSRAVNRWQGAIWFDMAQVYDAIGEARSAIESARKSIAGYEAAGDPEAQWVRDWLATHYESDGP